MGTQDDQTPKPAPMPGTPTEPMSAPGGTTPPPVDPMTPPASMPGEVKPEGEGDNSGTPPTGGGTPGM